MEGQPTLTAPEANVSAFHRSIGIVSEDDYGDDEATSGIQTPERADIARAAAKAPDGLPPAAAPAPNAGNYPAHLQEALNAPAPTVEPVDYSAQFRHYINPQLPTADVIDEETFMAALTERNAASSYLTQQVPQYKDYVAYLAKDYSGAAGAATKADDDHDLIAARVTADLGNGFNKIKFDNEMAGYVEEGELTDDGVRYADYLRTELHQWVETQQRAAASYGKDQAQHVRDNRAQLATALSSYKAHGQALAADDVATISTFILGGGLQTRLDNLTDQEAIDVARVLNPSIDARVALSQYNMGSKQGANRRLASSFN